VYKKWGSDLTPRAASSQNGKNQFLLLKMGRRYSMTNDVDGHRRPRCNWVDVKL